MINGLEATIQLLKASGLSVDQIASKHRYGESGVGVWKPGSRSIVIRQDGGDPNLYIEAQTIRIEVRFFASSDYLALELANELYELTKSIERVEQLVNGGTALIYSLLPTSGQSQLFDQDLKMDFVLQFYNVQVSEKSV
ncbi:MAG: hypothetical protein CVU42_13865 [Chloroflexi bacterium HGW-Chloroflexi-4]|jgi:hypothetical protein|nr:MAG: hypothetical protein CVU42_13865 [Chloroflexi bacterium HGW-Chloroflexi-4]